MSNFNKNKLYLVIIIIVLLILFIIAWLIGFFDSEETKVRKFIAKAEKAVEARSTLACTELISKNYKDKYGNDYESVLGIAHEFFGYYKEISVSIESIDITLNDSKEEANVEIVAQVIGYSQSEKEDIILEGEKGRFRLRLLKEDKKWKLSEIEFYEEIKIMDELSFKEIL